MLSVALLDKYANQQCACDAGVFATRWDSVVERAVKLQLQLLKVGEITFRL